MIAAGLVFWMNQGTPATPDVPETETAWKCASCDNIVKLTTRDADRETQLAGGIPLICQKCSEKKVYRVAECELCRTYYFSSDVPDSLGRCMICFPPKSQEFAPDEAPPVDEDGRALPPAV